ncbi:acyl-CoA dehydrogenase family protein [Amorphus coralli]|uniref:acyl-CoA dehydrogenase family protein n=1 Tax=Amorphus coralli TaxID=340680 RepID=UPI00036A00D9|nr:acyl-CoA dehydrogenase family protein [Amorphus coralli]
MPVFDGEDAQIVDSVAAFFARNGGIARVRRLRDEGATRDPETWRAAAEQGWIGILAPETAGGLDMPVRSAALLMQTAARSVPFEPFSAAIVAARLLGRIDAPPAILDDVLSGQAIALPLDGTGLDWDGTRLSGESPQTADVASADWFVVSCNGTETGLFLVSCKSPYKTVEAHATHDGGTVGTVRFDGAEGTALGSGSDAEREAADARVLLRLLRAAEAVGLAQEAFARTLDYLRARSQFGRPIGSFQALQHRAATIHVRLTSAEALLYEAVRAFGTDRQAFAADATFSRALDAAQLACDEAIQMHGAIGFTDELEIGFFLKRLLALSASADERDPATISRVI